MWGHHYIFRGECEDFFSSSVKSYPADISFNLMFIALYFVLQCTKIMQSRGKLFCCYTFTPQEGAIRLVSTPSGRIREAVRSPAKRNEER